MKGFQIQLDSEPYVPGQTITGRVIINSSHKKKITGIRLRWLGMTSVNWNSFSATRRKKFTSYTSEEYYFNDEEYIFGRNGGPDITLPPGHQSFPFTFVLPPGLPSTFEGKYGFVQYYLDVVIKRNWKLNPNVKTAFRVNGSLDLNLNPRAFTSGTCSKETDLGCLCFKNGPIGFNLRMNRSGFVPGEILQFTAQLYNHSSSPVRKTKISLLMDCTFYAKGKSNYSDSKVIAVERGPEIPAGETVNWDCSRWGIRIPQTPPTNLGGGRLIDVRYTLQILLRVPTLSCGIDVCETVPIVIGTIPVITSGQVQNLSLATEFVPFREIPTYAPINESYSPIGSRLPRNGATPPPVATASDLPPPSYAYAMGEREKYLLGSENSRDADSHMHPCPRLSYSSDFAPKYANCEVWPVT